MPFDTITAPSLTQVATFFANYAGKSETRIEPESGRCQVSITVGDLDDAARQCFVRYAKALGVRIGLKIVDFADASHHQIDTDHGLISFNGAKAIITSRAPKELEAMRWLPRIIDRCGDEAGRDGIEENCNLVAKWANDHRRKQASLEAAHHMSALARQRYLQDNVQRPEV